MQLQRSICISIQSVMNETVQNCENCIFVIYITCLDVYSLFHPGRVLTVGSSDFSNTLEFVTLA
jgi:hypothetical protein